MSLEFTFAVRLLEKFLRDTKNNPTTFRANLCAHICEKSTDRTLLHLIANMDLPAASNESLKKFLRLLLNSLTKNQISTELVKQCDKLGASPMHYACHIHNFAFIDCILEQFGQEYHFELLTCRDAMNVTPYSLLFWQIGRVDYSVQIREKIKWYTLNVVKKNDNFMFFSLAFFPVVKSFRPVAKIG